MKPRLIGITGGMGSGKSTVSNILRHLNYKVYNSDVRGKELIGEVKSIRDQLVSIFGDEIFKNNKLDSKALSRKIFKDDSSLNKINSIIHPEVEKDFNSWIASNSNDKYLFKESALLFETGAFRHLDKTVLIIADKNLRIKRVQKRDIDRSKKEIENIISKQIDEGEATKLADLTIYNNENDLLLPKVIEEIERLFPN
tara:strand:- start:33 stop:626 length:594 start_codon:yes stop_codon:yes gene_type:complete